MAGKREKMFEIVSVGNELLIGKVLNTNSHWICQKITELGGFVRRQTTVRDDIKEIASAVREALKRRADWIVMSGGLGPTYDDKTLEGVAEALRRRLVINRRALTLLKERYRRLSKQGITHSVELTSSRLKMVKLPRGASVLYNPVGSAPGVLVKVGRSKIVSLPGVPSELKAIFEDSIIPLIRQDLGRHYVSERTLKVSKIFESSLAPILDKIVSEYPLAYVKSHPKGVEEGVSRLDIYISAKGSTSSEASSTVERIVDRLRREIVESGGSVE